MRDYTINFYRKHNFKIMYICVFFFLVLAFLLKTERIANFDTFIYKHIAFLINDKSTLLVKIITSFGSFYMITIISLLAFILLKEKKDSKFIAINALIIFIISVVLKYIFLRERPIDINLITEYGYSFPSGHSAVSMAFYGFIAYLIYKNVPNNFIKKAGISLIILLVLLIGLSRIYLGVHYASDVVAGYLVSFAYLILFVQLGYKKNKSII